MTNVLITPQTPPLPVGDMSDPTVASTPGPAVVFSPPSATGDDSHKAPVESSRQNASATLASRPIAYREAGGDWHELGYEAVDHWEGLSPELRERVIADRTAQASLEEYSAATNGGSASMITSNWVYSGSPRMYRIAGELRDLAEVVAEIRA